MAELSDMLAHAAIVPASEVLCKIIEEINATVNAAKDVLFEKQNFAEVSSFLERIVPVLKELIRRNIDKHDSSNAAIEILSREVRVARQLTLDCCYKNKVYLLLNCKRIVKKLQDVAREISHALDLIPLASIDLSSSIRNEIDMLSTSMLNIEFKAALSEEMVLEQIETGIQERYADRATANKLLLLIAEAVGVSSENSELRKVFDELKNEIEEARRRKDQAEAIQMEQIIAFLSRSDAALSPRERVRSYFTKRNSLGNQPLEPLSSFRCPITHEVMVDPVETPSGLTFERSAIEKWLADGNITCPLTMNPLNSGMLRPNITLRKSVEEWKDRNTIIMIAQMKSKLSSGDEQDKIQCLCQLLELCEERDLHREWVALEDYIPILVELLGRHNLELRQHALPILYILAKDHDDNKKRIAEVDNSIELIVRALARRTAERKFAVALLLELAKVDGIRDRIGKAQGAILLLVTISNSENTQAAKDARDLLENLSFLDEYVVQMAKSNYFKPLIQRLTYGSTISKKTMAETLAEVDLMDHMKSTLFDDGVDRPLICLVTEVDECKKAAVEALSKLSALPKNALKMIKDGALTTFLTLLYDRSAVNIRDHVANIIMNLAVASSSAEASDTFFSLLDSDDELLKLATFIPVNTPKVQRRILRTLCALCKHPSAADMRTKLKQFSAVPILIQLCEHSEVDLGVRENAVKLFYCLTGDDEDDLLVEHVSQKFLERIAHIMKTSKDKDEKAASVGIIANLPRDHEQITQHLLTAGALEVLMNFLKGEQKYGPICEQLMENAAKALCRFTVSKNMEWQKRAAELEAVTVLVQLLGSGSALVKEYAAVSLGQFSDNSFVLSEKKKKRLYCFCLSTPPRNTCPVHMGVCTVEQSFCLVMAGAVDPLIRLLGCKDSSVSEACLQSVSTLIEAELLQNGCKVISEANGILAIIRLLSEERSPNLQEKALSIIERVFRLEEYKTKYVSSARMPLVDITHRGTAPMKRLAARTLAHLNVLNDQSSYF